MADYRQISEDLTDTHPRLAISQKLEKLQKVFLDKKKPFCYRCGMIDWEKQCQEVGEGLATIEAKKGFIDFENEGIIPKHLEKYGISERFVWIKDSPAKDSRVINGVRSMVDIGFFREYLCKERGCRLSIEVRQEDLDLVKEDPIKAWTESNKKEANEVKKYFSKENFKAMSPMDKEKFFKKTRLI